MSEEPADARTATCSCSALRLTASGEPIEVYACSCLDCQKASGSVFTYIALFPAPVTSIEGEYQSWRRSSDSGRWVESCFCPVCGSPVFGRAESSPGVIQISAGCFADPSFAIPATLYWSSRKHHWLPLLAGTKALDEQ